MRREYSDGPCVFATERGGAITPATIRKMVARAGKRAGLAFHVNPHILRHATGYKLAKPADHERVRALVGSLSRERGAA